MKAISIRQPWAYAILHLGKNVENRPMRTHFRGPILIHTSLKIEKAEALKLKLDLDKLVVGSIIGSVEIIDCVNDSRSRWAIPGQWHWLLRNPHILDQPIPMKGKLGLMNVPDQLLKGARFRLNAK